MSGEPISSTVAAATPMRQASWIVPANSEEEAVATDLTQMITEVVAAAGRGAESLRLAGNDIELRDCSIEVMLDDQPSPSAHVKVTFGRAAIPVPEP